MKISQLVPAIGVLAFCVSFGAVRAQDNPAQAAAREALMKQMSEEPAMAPKPPLAESPVVVKHKSKPAVVHSSVPMPIVAPAAVTSAPSPAAEAAAREALMKRMSEVPATAPKPSLVVAPAPAVKIVAPPTAISAPVPVMATHETKRAVVNSPVPVPIVAPALPISATKEQRLQGLLMLYKGDQITPEQYHTQRAAILAEP